MANANSYNVVQNLPAISITGTAEICLLVPAVGKWGANFPSAQYPAGSGLCLPAGYDLATGGEVDCHVFKIRLMGDLTVVGATNNLTLVLYRIPYASIGVTGSGTTAAVTSAGAHGTAAVSLSSINIHSLLTSYYPASGHFFFEWTLLWDSTIAKLDGFYTGLISSTATAGFSKFNETAVTQLTSGVTSSASLNFMPGFTFSSAAANSITVTEFSIEKL
jgi:hypothetical protein